MAQLADTGSSGVLLLETLCKDLPKTYDLPNESLDEVLTSAADRLLEEYAEGDTEAKLQQISDAVSEDIEKADAYPIGLHLVEKLARSKYYVKNFKKSVKLTIVVPMYKENNRIKTSKEEENGENFVRRKYNELKWLFDDSTVTWELMFVDDGCPDRTGNAVQAIIDDEGYENVAVKFLQDGIDAKEELITNIGLTSTKESQKAGAIYYGSSLAMKEAKEDDASYDCNVLCFTDCDMSAPLGQTGLLLQKLVGEGIPCVVGRRYGPGGLKSGICGLPNTLWLPEIHRVPMILRTFSFQTLLPPLASVTDTQCGLKAFDMKLLREVLPQMKDLRGTFDIELLLRILTRSGDPNVNFSKEIASCPIFWIDSPAESNFWTSGDGTVDLGSYLPFFHRIVKTRKAFIDNFPKDEGVDALAAFYEGLQRPEFMKILECAAERYQIEKIDFGCFFELEQLREWTK